MEIVPNPYGRRLNEKEISLQLEGADGLIAGLEPLTRTVFQKADKLKAVARIGIGLDNVDMQAAQEIGISVSNTPSGPTEAVAEMCLTALLAINRQMVASSNELHTGKWNKRMGQSLRGRKILLIGYGRIGRKFADYLHCFGSEILVADPKVKQSDLQRGEMLVSTHEGLSVADVISLHANGVELILGELEFAKLKAGAVLLNSARAQLVDENALIKSLEDGTVSQAWFDAFWEEPYSGPLINYDQVLLTPHISTYTVECRRQMELDAVKNLLGDLEKITGG